MKDLLLKWIERVKSRIENKPDDTDYTKIYDELTRIMSSMDKLPDDLKKLQSMSKYIDAERLKELLDAKYKEFTEKAKKDCPLQYQYRADGLDIAEQFIDSLQQEQPDFPTTDEEVEKFLATHPKVEVPDKYKTSDWLFKKLEQEQPEVDLKNEIITQWSKCNPTDEGMGSEYAIITVEQFDAIARHFCELRLNARKENQ